MTDFVGIDYDKFNKTLRALFPNITFFPPSHSGELDKESRIYNLIKKIKITDYENKKLLVREMFIGKKFDALFPKDALLKEQIFDKLNAQNGVCSVIKAYMEIINEEYIQGFNSVVREKIRLKGCDSNVVDFFENEIFEKKSYFIDDLVNTKKAKEIFPCEHSVSSIYKAFGYYARKQYTLIRLGREFLIREMCTQWKDELKGKIENADTSSNYWGLGKDKYYVNFMEIFCKICDKIDTKHADTTFPADQLAVDIKLAWDAMHELFVLNLKRLKNIQGKEASDYKDVRFYDLRFHFTKGVMKMINYIIEGTPKNGNSHIPADFIGLAGQISGQLGQIKKVCDRLETAIKNDKSYDLERDVGSSNEITSSNIEINKTEGDYAHNDLEATFDVIQLKIYWNKFMKNSLSEVFNAEEERGFLNFIFDDKNWAIVVDELFLYESKEDDANTVLFNKYKGDRSNVPHHLFSNKIRRALDKCKKKHEDACSKEVQNGTGI